ncbi:MAG: type II toxin-antitoxin system Phd/YefM family antitoxin [Vulcanimicrobiota bacterium]
MEHRVSATEAARNFSELLNRAHYRSETFVITRGGQDVARLSPTRIRSTWGDLLDLIGQSRLDPDFADDLEIVQTSQPQLPEDPWDS